MLASPRGTGPVLSRRPQQPTRRAWHRAHRVPGARMRAPELPARNPAHAGLSALYPSCGEARAALLCDESGAAPTSEVPRWAPRLAGSACADRHRGLPCFPRTQGCQGHRRARRLAALLRTNSRAELTSDFGSFRALLAGNSRLSPQPTRDALSAEDRDGSEMAAPAFPARAVASATPDLSVAADEQRKRRWKRLLCHESESLRHAARPQLTTPRDRLQAPAVSDLILRFCQAKRQHAVASVSVANRAGSVVVVDPQGLVLCPSRPELSVPGGDRDA